MQNQISVQPVTATLTQGIASAGSSLIGQDMTPIRALVQPVPSQVVQSMPLNQSTQPAAYIGQDMAPMRAFVQPVPSQVVQSMPLNQSTQPAAYIGQDMAPMRAFVQTVPYGTGTSAGLGSTTVSNVSKPTVPPNPNPDHITSTSTNKFGTEKCGNMADKMEASGICREQNQTGNVDISKISSQSEMCDTLSDKTNIPDKSLGSGSRSSVSRYSVGQIKVRSKSNCSGSASSVITTVPAQPSGVVLPSSGSSTKSVTFGDGISTEVFEYCRTQSSSTEVDGKQRKTGPEVPEPPMSKNGQYSLNGRDPRYSRHLLDLVTTLALQNEVSGVYFVQRFQILINPILVLCIWDEI